ncbi:MAG: hypothetical protein N3F03_01930 [Ignavibacteria bacterium]|nr:hypothetical protein [Ignavibacteria bacterium]
MQIKIVLLISLILFSSIKAQVISPFDTTGSLVALAIVKENEVILRWAPKNYLAWIKGNEFGYKILRYRVNFQGQKPVEVTQIGKDTIKPLSLAELKNRFPADHPYAPVVAQALYGEKFQLNVRDADIFTARQITQEQELRFSIATYLADIDSTIAEALGLRIVDRNIDKNEQYLYFIIPHETTYMDTVFLSVDTRFVTKIPKAPDIEKNEFENRIELKWNIENYRGVFTAYWIERSEDGVNWIRLNKKPYVQGSQRENPNLEKFAYFTDSTIQRAYKIYKYRIIGITPFGELSLPSNVIEAMGRDRTPPEAPVITSVKDIGGKISIEWKIDKPPRDLKGFVVSRTNDLSIDFVQISKGILPPNVRSFVDDNPSIYGENYYVVVAVDTANNFSVSLPSYGFIVDSIPPAKPKGLKGNIDTLGIVRISWNLGSEPDIVGYRVYFANQIDHEFSNLTPYPIQDTTFVDTIDLNTLTEEIFYQVVAVDRNFNHSEKSDILRLIKPDRVPPVTPLISDYKILDTAVVINFIPSSSEDVVEHVLLRKSEKENDWKEISRIRSSAKSIKTNFVDRQFVDNVYVYYYTIQAIDEAGNKSQYSPLLGVRIPFTLKKQPVKELNATYDKQKKAISLYWKKLDTNVKYFVIFRKTNGKNFESLVSVNADAENFIDTDLIVEGEYQYGIKAVFVNGESDITYSNSLLVIKGDEK